MSLRLLVNVASVNQLEQRTFIVITKSQCCPEEVSVCDNVQGGSVLPVT